MACPGSGPVSGPPLPHGQGAGPRMQGVWLEVAGWTGDSCSFPGRGDQGAHTVLCWTHAQRQVGPGDNPSPDTVGSVLQPLPAAVLPMRCPALKAQDPGHRPQAAAA